MEDWEKDWIDKINVQDMTGCNEMFLGCGMSLNFAPGAIVRVTVSHEPKHMAEVRETIDGLRKHIKELQDLLRDARDNAAYHRGQHDALQARLDEISELAAPGA